MTDSKIVPFGKYKGQPVEMMQADVEYTQWLLSQDWFKTKFDNLYQVIINAGTEPVETPEHNALQVLFLDDEFCLAILDLTYPNWSDLSKQLKKKHHSLQWMTDPENSHYNTYQTRQDAQKDKEHLEKFDWSTPPIITIDKKFELRGVDVVIEAASECSMKFSHDRIIEIKSVGVEIKPSIGDDYPNVLRQMRNNRAKILLVKQYTGIGATKEQFVTTFKTAGIDVVFLDEIKRR